MNLEEVLKGRSRQSVSSILLTSFATSSLIFLSVFGGTYFLPVMIENTIMVVGLVMSLYVGKLGRTHDVEIEETDEDSAQGQLVGVFALGALGVFSFLTWVLKPIVFSAHAMTLVTFSTAYTFPLSTSSEYLGALVFTVLLVPVAEEQFFRGFWGTVTSTYLPPGIAEIANGGVFMVFHAAVYSLFAPLNTNLILLLTSGGAVFLLVDVLTRDITTSMLGHVGNNALSFLASGSVIAYLAPGLRVPPYFQAALPLAVPALVAGIIIIRQVNARERERHMRTVGMVGMVGAGSALRDTVLV